MASAAFVKFTVCHCAWHKSPGQKLGSARPPFRIRLKPRLHETACCQTHWQPVRQQVRYRVYKHPTGCQTCCSTGWMFVYKMQPVVRPVEQPVVSCKRSIRNAARSSWFARLSPAVTAVVCRLVSDVRVHSTVLWGASVDFWPAVTAENFSGFFAVRFFRDLLNASVCTTLHVSCYRSGYRRLYVLCHDLYTLSKPRLCYSDCVIFQSDCRCAVVDGNAYA